jgi:hypothetical protein
VNRLSFTPSNMPNFIGEEAGGLGSLKEDECTDMDTIYAEGGEKSKGGSNKRVKERLCANCFVLRSGGLSTNSSGSGSGGGRTFSLSQSASGLGRAMKGWSPIGFKSKQSNVTNMLVVSHVYIHLPTIFCINNVSLSQNSLLVYNML